MEVVKRGPERSLIGHYVGGSPGTIRFAISVLLKKHATIFSLPERSDLTAGPIREITTPVVRIGPAFRRFVVSIWPRSEISELVVSLSMSG